MYHKWCWLQNEWPEGHTKLGSLNYNSVVEYKTLFYLFGGFGENGSGLSNLWCLKNTVWGIIKTSGKTPSPRYKHRSCVASDRMWVFGGCQMENKHLGDFFSYEFSTNKWKRIKSKGTMPCARFSHTLTTYDEDRIVLHGGCGSKKSPLNDLWFYIISENKWVEYSPEQENIQPIPRHSHTTVVMNKELFVFGGENGQTKLNTLSKCQFIKKTVQWANLEPYGKVPNPRRDHSAVTYQNKMFIFGGYRDESVNELWMYEYYTNSWTRLKNYGEVPCARHHHSAVVIGDTMSIYGGWVDRSVLYDLHTLNISGDIVTTIQFNKLKEGCREMFEKQEFCDLEIKTKNGVIGIHECVMKARTGLFGNYYYSRNKYETSNFQFNSKKTKTKKLKKSLSCDSTSSSSSSFSTTMNFLQNINRNEIFREQNNNQQGSLNQINEQNINNIRKISNNFIYKQRSETENQEILNNETTLFTIFDDLKNLKRSKKKPIEILNKYTKNASSYIVKTVISFIYTGEFEKELLFSKINKKILKSKNLNNKNKKINNKEYDKIFGLNNNINKKKLGVDGGGGGGGGSDNDSETKILKINNDSHFKEKKGEKIKKQIPKQFLTTSIEDYETLETLICALKIVEVLDVQRLLQIIQTEIEMRIRTVNLVTILALMYQKKINCINFRAYLFNRLRRYRESVSNSIGYHIKSRKLLVDMLKVVCRKTNLPCDYNKKRYPTIVSDYQFLFDNEVKYFHYHNKNKKFNNKLFEKESENFILKNNKNNLKEKKKCNNNEKKENKKDKEKEEENKNINKKENENEKEKGKEREREKIKGSKMKMKMKKEMKKKKKKKKKEELFNKFQNSNLENNSKLNQKNSKLKNQNDFVIKCYDGEIHVHKPIILAHSIYIKTAVTTKIGKENENEIITEFIDKSNRSTEALYCLIRFIYTGKFDHILNNFKIAYELLGASAYYQLKDDSLDYVCYCILKNSINQKNVLYLLNKAENLQSIELRDYAMKFTLLHSKSVLTKENLKKITDLDLLRELLTSKLDDL
ncbi:rab9 effector protein with kelch motifs [Anaeramoeba flamelloides]|uniref:Rab9 effector protein with kelch motifs n=1 Tax=Anaeramoeba flamelloides TaxID=1746091 RepID=A0AAV8AHH4_9EUKA|nr:rab9 effector protein with kelch motifs [Anaeramoeba flamelloides]